MARIRSGTFWVYSLESIEAQKNLAVSKKIDDDDDDNDLCWWWCTDRWNSAMEVADSEQSEETTEYVCIDAHIFKKLHV